MSKLSIRAELWEFLKIRIKWLFFPIASLLLLAGIILIGGISAAQIEETNSPPRTQGRMKPPPEAIAACQGKSEGTAVQFTTTRGDTVKGVCKQFEGVLAAMPERGAPPPEGKQPREYYNK
jgi:hypothetical protein